LRPPSTQSRPDPFALADHQPVAEDIDNNHIDGSRTGELDDPSFRAIIENIRPLCYTEKSIFGRVVFMIIKHLTKNIMRDFMSDFTTEFYQGLGRTDDISSMSELLASVAKYLCSISLIQRLNLFYRLFLKVRE
jgi:hypothetical protein